MKPAVFHDQARAELAEAAAWYETQRPGLGGEFRREVEEAVERIRENPDLGTATAATRFRYRLVRRFPYVIFYVECRDAVRIMAVAHGKRRPGYWSERASD